MVDPITIAGALTLVKGALDSAKSLQDLLKKEKPDITSLREQIQLLREQLLDAKDGLLDMRDVNLELQNQIAQMKLESVNSREQPVRVSDYYYFAGPNGQLGHSARVAGTTRKRKSHSHRIIQQVGSTGLFSIATFVRRDSVLALQHPNRYRLRCRTKPGPQSGRNIICLNPHVIFHCCVNAGVAHQ